MGSNYENSNLYPDWSDQNLNDNLPLDLQDCELRNPSLSNFQSGLIAGTSFAGVEQSWVNDPYVGSNHQGNNLVMNDEVEYSRTASNSPGRRQYSDLQIADIGEQLGFSSLQTEASPNNGNCNGPQEGYSLFPMDCLTPLQPPGSYEFYTNEPRNNLTTENGPFTHGHSDYQWHDLSDLGINIVPEECGLSYPDLGAQPSHGLASETSLNNQLPESGPICTGVEVPPSFEFVSESVNPSVLIDVVPSCSSHSMPSGNAFLGDPENSGFLGRSETNFTLIEAWQPPQDRSNENPGSSFGADTRSTQQIRSSVSTAGEPSYFPQDCGGETSDSSGYYNCQDTPDSNNRSRRQKRYRTPQSKYEVMTTEEKLSRKRKLEARASKKYWDEKRKSGSQIRKDFEAESTRNLDLQENLTREQIRVHLMNLVLQNLNINPDTRRTVDEDEEDTLEE